MERVQAARDAIFTGVPGPKRRKWIAAMLALLDAYEVVLSSDADWEAMRQAGTPDCLTQVSTLARALADDVDGVALALVSPAAPLPDCEHGPALAALQNLSRSANPDDTARLEAMRIKLARTVRRVRSLADTVARSTAAGAELPALDLSAFVQTPGSLLATLRGHLHLTSPVMRYAIRLALAMLAGYGVTLAVPQWVHGGWVLLTVALIMRASYAITRQRRNDRIFGTLAGCAAAAIAIPLLPPAAIVAGVIIFVGLAHAYATVNYKVTSFSASVMSLMLLHFLEPHTAFLADRIVDTLIGAALSVLFSYVLPSWERGDIPRLIVRLIDADRAFASTALSPAPDDHHYRLARKAALDSFTTLAMTTRRLSGEPGIGQQQFASLNELLAANYLFASDLASVQGLLRARRSELSATAASVALADASARVLEHLSEPMGMLPPETLRRRGWIDMPGTDAMAFLRRRLRHIEHSAQRLAMQAARAHDRS